MSEDSFLKNNSAAIVTIAIGVMSATGIGWNATHDEKGVSKIDIQVQIDTLKAQMSRQSMDHAKEAVFAVQMGRIRGLEGEEAVAYFDSVLDFAEGAMKDNVIWENEERPLIMRHIKRFEYMYGFPFLDPVDKNSYFMTSDNKPKLIHNGKPPEYPHLKNDIVYYRGSDDKIYKLNSLSPFIIKGSTH